MEVETTYTGVEVEVEFGMDELVALLRDGEVFVHTEDAPDLGFVYDQHDRAVMLLDEYREASGVEPMAIAQRDLAEVLNGEPAEWDHSHPPDVDVTLSFDADPDSADGQALGPGDFSAL